MSLIGHTIRRMRNETTQIPWLAPSMVVAFCCLASTVSRGAPSSMDGSPTAAPSAADRATIERIVAQWRTRAEKIGTLHCIASGKATSAKGCYNGCKYLPEGVAGDVPVQDHSFTISYDWLFDFKKVRFRIERRCQIFDTQELVFIPDATVTAFDGVRKPRTLARREWNVTASYSPSAKQPEFYVERPGPVLNTPDLIGLLAHGVVPRHGAVVSPTGIAGVFSTPHDFIVHGRAERRGRDCVVLRSVGKPPTNFTEYWVDERRQGAVVYWESRARTRKFFEFGIDYREVAGLWLPHMIEYTKYSAEPNNPPELFWRLKLDRVEPNVPVSDDLFRLEPDDGMLVWNASTAEPYRAGEATVSAASIVRWCFLVAVATVVIPGAVWLRRGARRRRVVVSKPP